MEGGLQPWFSAAMAVGLILSLGTPAWAQRGQPAAPAAAPAAPQSRAIAFQCPKAGTEIETNNGTMAETRTSQGADPSDPLLCVSKRSLTTTALHYGFYNRNISAEGLAKLRQGMADLFAGRTESFTAVFDSHSTSGGRFTYEDTWKRLDPETLTIAGKSISAVPFERTQRGMAGNRFQGVEKRWYDPASGVWVKRMRVSGGEQSQAFLVNWEVTKITAPQ